jgi:hypothetical protein
MRHLVEVVNAHRYDLKTIAFDDLVIQDICLEKFV